MEPIKLTNPVQYLHENQTWGRTLDFFKQENSYLKNRLSEALDTGTDKIFLARAEQFQNKFILKDEYIDELRHDINQQHKTLKSLTGGPVDDKINVRHEKLRNELEFFETDFNKLKNEFNKYLSTVL